MAVDAVVANVQLAADEKLGVRQVPLVELVPVLEPGDALARLLGPEVLEALGVDVGLGVGLVSELGWRREAPLLGEQGVDGVAGLDAHNVSSKGGN